MIDTLPVAQIRAAAPVNTEAPAEPVRPARYIGRHRPQPTRPAGRHRAGK